MGENKKRSRKEFVKRTFLEQARSNRGMIAWLHENILDPFGFYLALSSLLVLVGAGAGSWLGFTVNPAFGITVGFLLILLLLMVQFLNACVHQNDADAERADEAWGKVDVFVDYLNAVNNLNIMRRFADCASIPMEDWKVVQSQAQDWCNFALPLALDMYGPEFEKQFHWHMRSTSTAIEEDWEGIAKEWIPHFSNRLQAFELAASLCTRTIGMRPNSTPTPSQPPE